MKRIWLLLLLLSLGLNAGLLYATFSPRSLADPAQGENGPPVAQAPAAPPHGDGPACSAGDRLACDRLLDRRLDRMARWLDLEAGQRTAMQAILQDMLPRIMAERESVQRMRGRIHEEYMKPVIDPGRIRGFVADLNASQTRLDSLTAETILRESEVLDAGQRAGYFGSMPWSRCQDCPPGPDRDPRAGKRRLRK